MGNASSLIKWFETIVRGDVASVGGKNASLGEMVSQCTQHGIKVPIGFATTAIAYWQFINANNLQAFIRDALNALATGKATLSETGEAIRREILRADWPVDIATEITTAYSQLCERAALPNLDVAVRSSATAEDLPDASFAGQQETFLNVRGASELLIACKRCYASLFTDRAISYRQTKSFDHLKVALSIGVQQMVHADRGGSGVMFSIDPETGYDKVIVINAAWGLGENVVQGTVDPDEYEVFKPLLSDTRLQPIVEKRVGSKEYKLIYASGLKSTQNVPTSQAEREAFVLTDAEILRLSRWACAIEAHYGVPMDTEWAKDGDTGILYIVQARPETVQSRRDASALKTYDLKEKGRKLIKGIAIGEAIVNGSICIIADPKDMNRFVDGSILVATNTDPDWMPVMKRAAAIITDHGGRTSHAAIVSRELGLPAIVGTGNATHLLHDQQEVTVCCAEGDEGFVYEGIAKFEVTELSLNNIPSTRTKVMLNLANPAAAYRWWRLPADGVGLARMEFVISNHIRVHPMALLQFDSLRDKNEKQQIAQLTRGYVDKTEYFVDRLSRGLARIAAAFFPSPVIIRTSDFKTNEYANLLGGANFEPHEENPMIGFRGASRYYSPRYQPGFELECRALRRLRNEMGFKNVLVMIPFCRSTAEADKVLQVMANNGLKRGENGLEIYVMCEIPSNVILAKEFAQRFDGFSIGSNDLTQLTLGVDRDSEALTSLFDEQNAAVKWMIENVITAAHRAEAKVGLCGQAPSDHPEFAELLVACSIDSISVSPDSFAAVKQQVARSEAQRIVVGRRKTG